MMPATKGAIGKYRPEFLSAIDACLRIKHSERPESVDQLRPLLLGEEGRAKAIPKTGVTRDKKRSTTNSMVTPRRPWKSMAAVIVLILLGGAYVGLEHTRSNVPSATHPGRSGAYPEKEGGAEPEASHERRFPREADQRQREEEDTRRRKEVEDAADAEEKRQIVEQAEARRKEEQQEAEAVKKAAEEQARLEAVRLKEDDDRRKAEQAKKLREARKAQEDQRREIEAAAARKRRPDPHKYSGQVWSYGSIPTGQVVSENTQYGVLTCKGGNNSTGISRECWWR
jgi:hypothetical protein